MARELFNPGAHVTGRVSAQGATDGHFLAVAGARDGGVITVGNTAAGDRVFGVAGRTREPGQLVPVLRGSGRVVAVAATGPILAGADVAAGDDGVAVQATSETGPVVGYAVDDIDEGFVFVSLL